VLFHPFDHLQFPHCLPQQLVLSSAAAAAAADGQTHDLNFELFCAFKM